MRSRTPCDTRPGEVINRAQFDVCTPSSVGRVETPRHRQNQEYNFKICGILFISFNFVLNIGMVFVAQHFFFRIRKQFMFE